MLRLMLYDSSGGISWWLIDVLGCHFLGCMYRIDCCARKISKEEALKKHNRETCNVYYIMILERNYCYCRTMPGPYRAHIVDGYLNEIGIECLVWLARSPDMILIEHIWDQIINIRVTLSYVTDYKLI